MIIFVSGIYGTGKSHTLSKVSEILNIPLFDSSELIKRINKEDYSLDKSVTDVDINQQILIKEVKSLLRSNKRIILTGHFCIFDKYLSIVELPLYVYAKLPIELFINLEAKIESVKMNLLKRDNREYSDALLNEIQIMEKHKFNEVSNELNLPRKNIFLKYDDNDHKIIIDEIEKRM